MRIYIIRHGETNHNKKKIIQGQFDNDINSKGFYQAKLLANRFKDFNLKNVYSSDLKRAKNTALEVLKYHKDCKLVLDKRLRERSFGELENKNIPSDFSWDNLPDFVEKRDSLYKRVKSFLDDIKLRHKGEEVFIFTHGGIKRVMTYILNGNELPYEDLKFYNTSVTIVNVNNEKSEFKVINCTNHLD
ncbi:MAG: histidine phosphatase family protein [Candidatus Woesearchaeota archaeon]